MAEYIEREALQKKLSRMIDYYQKDFTVRGLTALFQVADAVMDCPAVDVAPVVHGRWEDTGLMNSTGEIFTCSCCFEQYNPQKAAVMMFRQPRKPKYCPNCGAKMDGGVEGG